MQTLLIVVAQITLAVFVALLASNLPGYPRIPYGGDDGFIYPHTVKSAIPDLSDYSYRKIKRAIQAHTAGAYAEAVEGYIDAQHGTLQSGAPVDLFQRIPGLRRNLSLARQNSTGNRVI